MYQLTAAEQGVAGKQLTASDFALSTNGQQPVAPNIPAGLVPNLEYIGIPAVVCDPAVTPCELFDPVVTGTVFSDLDSDGVQDVDDAPRPNAIVRTTPGNILTASGADGRYVMPISTGSYSVNGVPILYNMITTAAHAVNLTGPAQIDSLNDIGYHATPGVYDGSTLPTALLRWPLRKSPTSCPGAT